MLLTNHLFIKLFVLNTRQNPISIFIANFPKVLLIPQPILSDEIYTSFFICHYFNAFIGLGTIFASRTFDIILHDSFYVIGYLPISISFSLISGLMALIYFILQKTGKRINQKIGFWHWSLLILDGFF
jgi:heme/copper-type cytochrome/quinol oxidase subunit 1